MRKNKFKKKHSLQIEQRFSSEVVSRLINKIMKSGLKRKATKIVYSAADMIENDSSISTPFPDYLKLAIDNLKIESELKTFRRGSSNQRIPVSVRSERAMHLSLYWIVISARERSRKNSIDISRGLSDEIKNVNNNSGRAIEKKRAIENEVSNNMAFANVKKNK